MAHTLTRLIDMLEDIAATGGADSTDLINAITELTALAASGDLGDTAIQPASQFYTATTTELADVGDAINTTAKYVGKMVFNTTTGVPVWADAATAAGTWSGADGTVDHSPV